MIAAINIRAVVFLWAALLVSLIIGISVASAETIDTFIRQLKDASPDVRAKAAQELGGG